MSGREQEILLVILYILAVTLTTAISGALGPLASVIDSFFGIGLVIAVRNQLHALWVDRSWWLMPVLIVAGSVGSLAANLQHPRIALASMVAFLAANFVATLLYARGHHRWSVVAFAVVDSLVFPPIAFGAFVGWVVGGQIVAKITGAALWSRVFHS